MDQPTTALMRRLERKNRGKRFRSVLIIVLGSVTLATGCGVSATLQHKKTGHRVKCGPYDVHVRDLLHRCISDYQRQDYERVPE